MSADSVAPDAVVPLLRGRFGRPYTYFARCASTQRELDEEAPEGAVVATDEQTEGRGRLGRSWLAPPGTSILMSINLRPSVETPRLPELPIVAAKASAEAIEAVTAVQCEIKPPNDLLVRGHKLAGVLAEAREGRVVLGIGVNVNVEPDALPQAVERPATSLLRELGQRVDRARLLAEILLRLEYRYDRWTESSDGIR